MIFVIAAFLSLKLTKASFRSANGFTWGPIAEVAILVRIASLVFVIARLRGERPSGNTVVGAVVLAVVATVIVIIKVVLTH